MLTDDEADKAYTFLADVLEKAGLDWVLRQIDAELRLGNIEEKSVSMLKEQLTEAEGTLFDSSARFRRGAKAKLTSTRPYAPRERLGLLVDAIERSVVDTTDMDNAVAKFFFGEPQSNKLIVLIREDEAAQPITIEPRDDKRARSAARLRQLLQEIREEL